MLLLFVFSWVATIAALPYDSNIEEMIGAGYAVAPTIVPPGDGVAEVGLDAAGFFIMEE